MTLSSGTTLGPYAIVSQLGSGGMGVVYLATDPRLSSRFERLQGPGRGILYPSASR